MIKIIDSPQYSNNKISYGVSGDILTVTVNGIMDWIDFGQYPDGEATLGDVESTLPVNPFLSVKKSDGTTTVELLRFYGDDEKGVYESGFNTMEDQNRY